MLATSADLLNWTKQPSATFQRQTDLTGIISVTRMCWDETREKYVMLVTTRKDGKGRLHAYIIRPDKLVID